MVRAELHVVIDPVEGQHQVQFIGRPGGPLAALADLPAVIEIRQGIRAEAAVLQHSPRYQELRSLNISGVPEVTRTVTSATTLLTLSPRDFRFQRLLFFYFRI